MKIKDLFLTQEEFEVKEISERNSKDIPSSRKSIKILREQRLHFAPSGRQIFKNKDL